MYVREPGSPSSLDERRLDSPLSIVSATRRIVAADVEWLNELRTRTGGSWSHIASAKLEASLARGRIEAILAARRLPSAGEGGDASVVVFGSLARDEFLQGSDLDWTLLIDGRTMTEQRRITSELAREFELAGFGKPGRTGIFGHMASSHDLVHHIGGDADTNKNTTRRVLLLLESQAIGDRDAHERTIRAILDRYVEDDAGFVSAEGSPFKVPRFLLNDIVRFWRTMAVDYAAKRAERADDRWALRNAKLRMSRKLLFVAGLLLCFSVELHPSEDIAEPATEPEQYRRSLVSHLLRFVGVPPLELLAQTLALQERVETVRLIFDSYDEFLSIIESQRDHLSSLPPLASRADVTFGRIREISHAFQRGLSQLFFEREDLRDLVHKYGVF